MFRFSPHIAINVKRYEEAIKFYADTLGFEVVKHGNRETHFKKGNINFFVEEEEANPGRVFFEFEVDDFAAAEKELLDKGCRIIAAYSAHNKMFSDPYGLNFHVYEQGVDLPGVK